MRLIRRPLTLTLRSNQGVIVRHGILDDYYIIRLDQGAHMPNVGAGLMKADPHIGPITQDEVVDNGGTSSEVRRISTPRGWATYDPKSNEVVVFVSATGEILADGGNHWTGTLRQVRAPFP